MIIDDQFKISEIILKKIQLLLIETKTYCTAFIVYNLLKKNPKHQWPW